LMVFFLGVVVGGMFKAVVSAICRFELGAAVSDEDQDHTTSTKHASADARHIW
jgi:hypothetical protein